MGYITFCHSIGTYDMVQEDVSSRSSFIIPQKSKVFHFKLSNNCSHHPRVVSNIFTYSYSDYFAQRTLWTSLNVSFHISCYIVLQSESSLGKKIRIWIWISVANNPGVFSSMKWLTQEGVGVNNSNVSQLVNTSLARLQASRLCSKGVKVGKQCNVTLSIP